MRKFIPIGFLLAFILIANASGFQQPGSNLEVSPEASLSEPKRTPPEELGTGSPTNGGQYLGTGTHKLDPEAVKLAMTLGIGILIFSLVIIALEILVILKRKQLWDEMAFKVVGLTLLINAGLFLIVTGYTQDQMNPMFGLLGALSGYLLGKDAKPPQTEMTRAREDAEHET
jgi:hypothetical protein